MKLQQKLALQYLRFKINGMALVAPKAAAAMAFDIFCTSRGIRQYALSPFFAGAQPIVFTYSAYRISGYRWNAGGSQGKILIVHGFSSHAQKFEHFITRLIAAGYEVLAFDAPAHGNSSGKQLNALLYKHFVQHLLLQYGPFEGIIAHSFGGLAAVLAVAEGTQHRHTRLALVAPAANTQTLIRLFFKQMRITSPGVKNYFMEYIKSISQKEISYFSINHHLPQVSNPVLWVQDRQDRIIPVEDALEADKLGLANVTLHFTSHLGHNRIYTDEKIVNRILDFITAPPENLTAQ